MAWDRSLGVRIPYQRLFLEEGTYVCAGCGHVACSRTDRNLFLFREILREYWRKAENENQERRQS